MLSEKAKRLGQEPAFPYAIEHGTEAWNGGMTIRMEFAKTFMAAILAKLPVVDQEGEFGVKVVDKVAYNADVADSACQLADALLEALAKEEG